MTISQLSIFVENRPGTLYEITDTLGHAGVDIRAMSIADTKDFGIMRLIVNDIEKAKKALEDNGYVVSETPVIAAAVFDRPGALTDIMKLLANNGINIEYMYAFITISKQHAYTVIRVEDNDRAEEILKQNGIKLVTKQYIEKL